MRWSVLIVLGLAVLFALPAAGSSDSTRSHIGGIVPPIGSGVQRTAGTSTPRGSGHLSYHGGPVMRTNTTYAIYWLPPGHSFNGDNAGYESTINQFFADVAHDSGSRTNVYATDTQYYDTLGGGTHPSAYDSTFGGSAVVTDALPASGCHVATACLTDDQLQAEIESVVALKGWPKDGSTQYFLFTPPGVDSCFDSGGTECAWTFYCAYHSWFSSGGGQIIYANQPWARQGGCDEGQYPNGDADPTINVVSHEHNEAITDPHLDAWYDSAGYENGDKCAWFFGALSGADGAFYNQTINGHHYFLQEEYDNSGSGSCVQTGAIPHVTGFSPTSAAVGSTVTITGSDFTGATAVKFNGTPAVNPSFDSDTQITATVPAGATTGKISVTGPDGTGVSTNQFNVVPGAVITSFAPAAARVGAVVTITGKYFNGVTGVQFNGTPAQSFLMVSSTKITAVVAAGTTTGKITVLSTNGNVTSAKSFALKPAVSLLSPAIGPAGTSVIISGAGFTDATAVKFNGKAADSFVVDSDTQITAVTAARDTSGKVSVQAPGGTANSAKAFAVVAVTSLSPAKGIAGTKVTITGTNLTGATGVQIGGTDGTGLATISATKITVRVAPGTTTGTVAVATPSGTALSAKPFGIIPSISDVSPATGPAGTPVTITGSGFVGATAVKFGGKPATFGVDSDGQISATVPAGASSGKVTVTTPGGTATSKTGFKMVAVTSFSPAKGRPGTKVTIVGTTLDGATEVLFNGVDATNVVVVSPTRITATVAAGATTGPISVITPHGVAASAKPFTRT